MRMTSIIRHISDLRQFRMMGSVFLFCCALVLPEIAKANIPIVDTAQGDLAQKPEAEQADILAKIVRETGTGVTCSSARVSLEKAFDTGSGGWLVLCSKDHDYWVVVPEKAQMAALVMPCILAKAAGIECYASIRTVLPEHFEHCISSALPDRRIRACTAILQSGRFDDKPRVLFSSVMNRALAYAKQGYMQVALADFDKAVLLQPNDSSALHYRAKALLLLRQFDQALTDLDKALQQKPNEPKIIHERGYVYMKMGNYERAIEDFDRVLSLKPGFEYAVRHRAEALKAKETIGSMPAASQAITSGQSMNTDIGLLDPSKQAIYCMEASAGRMQQFAELVAALQADQDRSRTMLNQSGLSTPDRTQIEAEMVRLKGDTAEKEKDRQQWEADLNIFMDYFKKIDLIVAAKDPYLIQQMLYEARKDQQAVQTTYSACLRDCITGDASCKKICDDKADESNASKRMNQCREIAGRFKE